MVQQALLESESIFFKNGISQGVCTKLNVYEGATFTEQHVKNEQLKSKVSPMR